MSKIMSEKGEYKTGGWSAHYILIVCSLLYMVNQMDRQVFSAVLQPMKIELGLTDAQCGLAQTVFILGTALFSFPIAYLIDRWSRRKTLSLMALIWSAFTFVTGLGKNFIGVLIPRAVVGVGEAGFVPGGVAMISAVYSKKSTAKAMGIFNVASAIGAALGVILGGIISQKFGWRMPFYFFAIPGVILAILAFFMKDYKTQVEPKDSGGTTSLVKSIGRLLKVRTLVWYYLGYAAYMFMFTSVLSWFPSFIMRVRNVDEATAGTLWGSICLLAIVGAFLGGFLADFWQKKNPRGRILLATIAWLLSSIILIGILLTNFNSIGVGLAAAYAIVGTSAFPALYAISQDVVHVKDKGLSMGLAIFAQYLLGGAWGPYVIGSISDGLGGGASGLSSALMISTAGGFIAFLLLFIGSRFYRADVEKVSQEAIIAER